MATNKNEELKTAATADQTGTVQENSGSAPEKKDPKADWVEVYIPKTHSGDDPNFFVSVGGKNFLLPRGKTSKVPPAVKKEIDRSRRAQEKLDDTINSLLKKAENPVKT